MHIWPYLTRLDLKQELSSAVKWGYLSLMHYFTVISANVTINHIQGGPKKADTRETVWVTAFWSTL